MTTKRERRNSPCGNCPFRRSAPLAHWHPDEYRRLERMGREDQESRLGSALFGCHKDGKLPPSERGVCVGWLLHQRAHNVPSLRLRVALMTDPTLAEQLATAEGDDDIFSSITELVEANLQADAALRGGRR